MGGANIGPIHANYAHTWWTPEPWLDWVEATLGADYFDPCPANWDGVTDGLSIEWGQRNYCNHPGARGSIGPWWGKACEEMAKGKDVLWCAFSSEQERHMKPSPWHTPGWFIRPAARIGFVWGGPDTPKQKHGQVGKSPGNYTVFWSSVEPFPPPFPCVIVRTGR